MVNILLPNEHARNPCGGMYFFKKASWEGLVPVPAIEKRWGQPAEELPDNHPAWELEAEYIAQALTGYIYTLSPQRIIIGGRVGTKLPMLEAVLKKIRRRVEGILFLKPTLEGIY